MAKFYLLGNSSPGQMFGAVVKTRTKTLIIDGGTVKDCDRLAALLGENARIDGWFFTHPHHDHIGCFAALQEKYPHITV